MRSRELLELKALFQGRVQGVGFRAEIKRMAADLKLHGFVRNLSDGRVELLAQGEKATLELLLTQIHRAFEIEEVEHQFQPISDQQYTDFNIVR